MMPGMGGMMPGMEQSEELMQLMGVGRGSQVKAPKKKPGLMTAASAEDPRVHPRP